MILVSLKSVTPISFLTHTLSCKNRYLFDILICALSILEINILFLTNLLIEVEIVFLLTPNISAKYLLVAKHFPLLQQSAVIFNNINLSNELKVLSFNTDLLTIEYIVKYSFSLKCSIFTLPF